MFIAGINLLSPGEICMMAHFHSFATIMFQKKKKKEEKKKKKKKKKQEKKQLSKNVLSKYLQR